MDDTKTVTFDALIEHLKHTRDNHKNSVSARDPVIAAHIKDLDEWIDALLAAAPTPAAQSTGQEAVAERCAQFAELYRDEHASGKCCEETCNEIAKACRDYAAPVNGGERAKCECCNGRGEVGGLLPAGGGYESEECPECKGSGERIALGGGIDYDEYQETALCGECGGSGERPRAADAPQAGGELLTAVRELVDAVAPYAYPTPDKSDTVWAKLERVRSALSSPAKVGGDEREALIDAIEAMECPSTHNCSNPELFEQGYAVAQANAAALARAALSADGGERKDAERLDFMVEQQAWVQWTVRDGSIRQCQVYTQDEDENYHILSGEDQFFSTPREAIDAAIAANQAKGE